MDNQGMTAFSGDEPQEPSTSQRHSESVEDEPTSENLRRILQQVQSTMKERSDDLKSEIVSSTSGVVSPSEEELQAGQILGPFNVRPVDRSPNTSSSNVITVENGGVTQTLEILSDEPILQRLKTTTTLGEANALFYVHEDGLWLMTVRVVSRDEPLIGLFIQAPKEKEADENMKRFPCEGCDASFKSPTNLAAHRQLYCKARAQNGVHREQNGNVVPPRILQSMGLPVPPLNSSISLPTAGSAPSLPRFPTQNLLFLPVAYHDLPQNGIVQVLGPAQTFVPIAVGRSQSLSSSLQQLGAPYLLVNSHPNIPSTVKFSAGELNLQIPLIVNEQQEGQTNAGTKRRAVPVPSTTMTQGVVDLSAKRMRSTILHQSTTTPPTTSTSSTSSLPIPLPIIIPKQIDSNGEKRFVCGCGVSFSAQLTLRAHQEHYCKLASRSTIDPIFGLSRESPRKVPSRCSQCDFHPQSASQLSVHMRQVHAEVQAYVCQECGYRGFSQRGIRSHLRTHPNLDNIKFETLMNTHVIKVCHNGRTVSTSSEISERNGRSPEEIDANIKIEDSE
ncbi:unnamed protein product, partial [Mesorhabditis belari]|uniref:C2H2-type domain-containing protein n=1 Tax=Mesorhabditis belari TaxID=2138241 RepID=A0AAF3J3L6_9BILA